jgi:hypothetical protein
MSDITVPQQASMQRRVTARARSSADTADERRLRQGAAWPLMYFSIQGSFGLAWDIQWRASVGRDSFWTPPHILVYSGVAGAGLIA